MKYKFYKTKYGLFKWNEDLKPRLHSGFVGQITINIQISGEEMALIQKRDATITSKDKAEEAYLKLYGVVRNKTQLKMLKEENLKLKEVIQHLKNKSE